MKGRGIRQRFFDQGLVVPDTNTFHSSQVRGEVAKLPVVNDFVHTRVRPRQQHHLQEHVRVVTVFATGRRTVQRHAPSFCDRFVNGVCPATEFFT